MKKINSINGILGASILALLFIGSLYLAHLIGPKYNSALIFMYWVVAILVLGSIFFFLLGGLLVLRPYQSATATLFGGSFNGILDKEGIYFTNPFNSIIKVEMGMRNNETSIMTITEKDGKPIQVSVVYKWRIVDTYKALFSVEDYESYIKTQSEATCRKVLKEYSYNDISVKNDAIEKIEELLQKEMNVYGIEVKECELSSLSYSKEIATAMLQKQQADAVMEAKESIAHGVIKVIKAIRDNLSQEGIKMSQEDESKMISNLTVVMMSKETAQPVLSV